MVVAMTGVQWVLGVLRYVWERGRGTFWMDGWMEDLTIIIAEKCACSAEGEFFLFAP